uniref:Uncharacterized protein n=2 Tax=Meloidogyne TaxID=189290 RepID=A0A6V7THK4_MELEN|nr:unnamed protein product [Meloidogyne enterolobii]
MASQKFICFLAISSIFLLAMLMPEYTNAETCQECFDSLCGPPCRSSCDACQNCQDLNFRRTRCSGACAGFSGTIGVPDCQSGK